MSTFHIKFIESKDQIKLIKQCLTYDFVNYLDLLQLQINYNNIIINNKINCNKNHKLIYNKHNNNNKYNFTCYQCSKTGNIEECWNCKKCNYFICNFCYDFLN